MAPGASAPAAAAAWLCPAEPLPPAERCVPLLPGTLPSALARSRDAFSFAAPPPPSAPSLASPHPQQLLPSPRCEFGSRPSPHPGQTHPFPDLSNFPSQLPAAVPGHPPPRCSEPRSPSPGPQHLLLFPFSTSSSWLLSPPFPSCAASRNAGAGTWCPLNSSHHTSSRHSGARMASRRTWAMAEVLLEGDLWDPQENP